MSKGKIWGIVIIVFILIVIIGKLYNSESNVEKRELKALAMEVGLQDVKVTAISSGSYITNYQISSSNFDTFTYDEMLNIHDELSNYIYDVEIQQYVCNDSIYECDTYSRIVKHNNKEVYNDYENSKGYKNELPEKEAEENKNNRYANQYPSVGMREEYLRYTILGEPDSVEKCRDFDKLVPRAQSKEYEWEKTDEHGWWKVTVFYTDNKTGKVTDTVDLPSNNGIVFSITYTDEKGVVQSDYKGKSK